MFRRIIPLCLILALAVHGTALPDKKSKVITGNLRKDVDKLLPAGEISGTISNKVKVSPQARAAMLKFLAAIEQHSDSFASGVTEYLKKGKKPDPDMLGMTEEEISALESAFLSLERVESPISFRVSKINSRIRISGSEGNDLFNSIRFNLKEKTVNLGDYVLKFDKKINVKESNHSLKSPWRGYQWRYEEADNFANFESLEDLYTGVMISYEVVLGYIENTGKTYLSFYGREMYDGEQKVAFSYSVFF